MYVILTCHTEVDRANQYGDVDIVRMENQSFYHITYLLSFLSKYEIPLTFSLMVGGQADKRLLEFVSEGVKFPLRSELSIHFHFEKFDENNGIWENNSPNMDEMKNYYNKFQEILKIKPNSSVFGHWIVSKEALDWAEELNIEVDGSFAPYEQNDRFIIRNPFKRGRMLEVPVISDGKYPLSPFISIYHLELLKQIIKLYHEENIVLHLGFHSYDFFDFNDGKIIIKNESLIAFDNLISYIKKYKSNVITLSDALKYNFDSYTLSDIPFKARLDLMLNLILKRIRKKLDHNHF